MIFVVDIGNSNIAIGGVDDKKIHFTGRLSTDKQKTDLEYAIDLHNIMEIFHVSVNDFDGCIISSVVPQITNIVKRATEQIFGGTTMVLKSGIKTGLNICLDNPAEM